MAHSNEGALWPLFIRRKIKGWNPLGRKETSWKQSDQLLWLLAKLKTISKALFQPRINLFLPTTLREDWVPERNSNHNVTQQSMA
jgi:hypothetical protein